MRQLRLLPVILLMTEHLLQPFLLLKETEAKTVRKNHLAQAGSG